LVWDRSEKAVEVYRLEASAFCWDRVRARSGFWGLGRLKEVCDWDVG
jgi:hypothetical protein